MKIDNVFGLRRLLQQDESHYNVTQSQAHHKHEMRRWQCLSVWHRGCARGLFSRDRDLEARGRDRGVDNSSRGETKTKAFRARARDEAEAYHSEARPSRGTTAPRDRGVKTEATSHIHIIPRTDVVLKREA